MCYEYDWYQLRRAEEARRELERQERERRAKDEKPKEPAPPRPRDVEPAPVQKQTPPRRGLFSGNLVCAARSAAAAVEALLGERDEREDLGLLRRFFLRVAVGDELRKLGHQR